mmetsp:Transcript_7763/g.15872  ORF Transcript_7763/g.15872 Transcript_7763/m.15872 type:complete len:264 (+) Transcript_7763:121-912(+)
MAFESTEGSPPLAEGDIALEQVHFHGYTELEADAALGSESEDEDGEWATPDNPATFEGSPKAECEDGADEWGTFESAERTSNKEDQSQWRVAVEWVDGNSAEAQEGFGFDDNWERSYPSVSEPPASGLGSIQPDGYAALKDEPPEPSGSPSESVADRAAEGYKLTKEQCATIKNAMAGLDIKYKPAWASWVKEEVWLSRYIQGARERMQAVPKPARSEAPLDGPKAPHHRGHSVEQPSVAPNASTSTEASNPPPGSAWVAVFN